MEQYYAILGVTQNATKSDIKKAYRRMAMRYHPDKNNNDLIAAQKFLQLTEAYEILLGKRKAPFHPILRQQKTERKNYNFRRASYRQRWEHERSRRRHYHGHYASQNYQKDDPWRPSSTTSKYIFRIRKILSVLYISGILCGIGMLLFPLVVGFYHLATGDSWWQSHAYPFTMLAGFFCINICNRIRLAALPYLKQSQP